MELGDRGSQRRLGGDEGRMGSWSQRRVAAEPSNRELCRRVAEEPGDGGHKGGTRPGDGGLRRRLDDGRDGRSKHGDEGRNVGFHDGGSRRSRAMVGCKGCCRNGGSRHSLAMEFAMEAGRSGGLRQSLAMAVAMEADCDGGLRQGLATVRSRLGVAVMKPGNGGHVEG